MIPCGLGYSILRYLTGMEALKKQVTIDTSSKDLKTQDYNPSASPIKNSLSPCAPGSGTPCQLSPPTYTDRPKLAFISLVFCAPLFAAAAASFTSPVFPNVSTNGANASTSVRSPFLAGVYFPRLSSDSLSALAQILGVICVGPHGSWLRKLWARALRKMA